jgi:hypothetical protein
VSQRQRPKVESAAFRESSALGRTGPLSHLTRTNCAGPRHAFAAPAPRNSAGAEAGRSATPLRREQSRGRALCSLLLRARAEASERFAGGGRECRNRREAAAWRRAGQSAPLRAKGEPPSEPVSLLHSVEATRSLWQCAASDHARGQPHRSCSSSSRRRIGWLAANSFAIFEQAAERSMVVGVLALRPERSAQVRMPPTASRASRGERPGRTGF